jgi:hypothetical protein
MEETITLGGRQLAASSLNLRAIRKLAASGHLERMSNQPEKLGTAEQIDAVVAIVAASVGRRHPEITEDWILDNAEPQELPVALKAVMRVAQFKETSSPNGESRS